MISRACGNPTSCTGQLTMHENRRHFYAHSLHMPCGKVSLLAANGPKIQAEALICMAGPSLTLYLMETPFNTFANRVDPDQAAPMGAFCKTFDLY